MSKYNWTKEDILNSNLSDKYKSILLAELEGKILPQDPSNTRINMQKHLELGRNFRYDMHDLQELNSNMADISLNECLNYAPDDETIINIPLRFLTPEQLANEVSYFYSTLEDEEITQIAQYLMDAKNGHLKIEDNTDNFEICDEIRGRCIKDPYQNVIFASYYMRKSLLDFPILSHEVGHMISAKLFGSKINPIIKTYLSELEAYYFELLCCSYIDSVTTDKNLLHVSHNVRLVKTIDYLWFIRKQYLLSRHLIKPSYKKLNQELARIPNADQVNHETFSELYRFRTHYINEMIHSLLAALDLYYQTLEDKEKGLYLFRKLMLSDKINIIDLFSEANITYIDDECANLQKLHEESIHLRKIAN